MAIQRLSCFFNLCSSCSSHSNRRRRDCLLPPPRGRLCCRAGLTAPLYSHRWPSQKNVTVADSSDPPPISSHARKCLLITHKKMSTPLLAGTQYSGRLTCGPTKLTGTEGFVNLVNMHDSSSSDRTMSIQQP